LAAILGFVVYLLHRSPSISVKSLVAIGYRFLAGSVVVPTLFALLLAMAGFLPSLERWPEVLRFILDNASGFAGRRMTFNPLFALIAAHTFWVSVKYAVSRARRPLGPEASFVAAMAATTFTWLAYFINGPDINMLWSALFPYSFVAASTLLHARVLGWLGK